MSPIVGFPGELTTAPPWKCKHCYYSLPDPVTDPFYQDTVKPLMYFCASILVFVSVFEKFIWVIDSLGYFKNFHIIWRIFTVIPDRAMVLSSHARLSNLAKSTSTDGATSP